MAMVVAISAGATHNQVSAVWTVCLLVMSAGCFVNAIRCGRLHCALTGPFFLLMAVSTLLYGLEVLSLGDFGWELIGAVTAAGGACRRSSLPTPTTDGSRIERSGRVIPSRICWPRSPTDLSRQSASEPG